MDEIDRLFELPLDEFTAERNALAKRLKQAGDAEAAEQVRALAKPSVAAWAVNQLARREPEEMRSLLNVGGRLRSAQERSLKGERTADELRAAQAEERDVIRDLTRSAEALLRESGRPASGTTLERVSSLLRAGAVSDPTALREGRLTATSSRRDSTHSPAWMSRGAGAVRPRAVTTLLSAGSRSVRPNTSGSSSRSGCAS